MKSCQTPGPHSSALAALLLCLCYFCASALAGGVVNPPIPHWIGPEPNCDYPTIQAALDDIFDCGIFPCPLGRNELRLSANYNHSGQVVVSRTFDIRGGFATCEGSFTGANKTLSAVTPGIPLFVVRPGNATIDNLFRNLSMYGNLSGAAPSRGGVINMESGNATLTLTDSLVNSGRATLSGGGVAMAGNGNRLVIDNTQISQNKALEGGGIFCNNAGSIDFRSGTIEENIAGLSGGGIYMQAGCQLTGTATSRNRLIRRNSIPDSQFGQGAGVYALSSNIELGALFSRTRIEENIVNALPPLHNYDLPGDNRGGGVHLDSSNANFMNTWFRGNEAADGGAISAVGNSQVLVDRSSGPCFSTDTGNSADCSLFEYNRARGGTRSDGDDEGGDGAVIFLSESLGFEPVAAINRSTWRFNAAGCYEIDPPLFTGECDLDSATGISSTSIAQGIFDSTQALVLRGNVIYQNDIGDDDDCTVFSCLKFGHHIARVGLFSENTTYGNLDADRLYSGTGVSGQGFVVNNIISDPASDTMTGSVAVASCNVTNFAEVLNNFASSIPIGNVDLDPQFIDPANEDFRITVPSSPAIDRCDDANDLASLSYDILGTPRPLNISATTNGPGERDVGAFEAKPPGYVNNSIDLESSIESDAPKTAEVFETHQFTASVRNTGRNGTTLFNLAFDFPAGGTVASLTSANDINGNPGWDCNPSAAECSALSNLSPGGTTPPITLNIQFDTPGLKTVSAHVQMLDSTLLELTPDNNIDGDTVTILLNDAIFADDFDS